MSRRRLILAAVVLAFLAGWWYWPVGLSQEEQQIIGSWRYCCTPNGFWPNGATYICDYLPDRTYRCQAIDGRTGSALNPIHGRWRIQDGNLAVTWDGGFIDNIRRALPAGCPGALPRNRDIVTIIGVSSDELLLRNQRGQSSRMTRIPPD